MYKKIPGSLDYRIDIDGNIVDIYGNLASLDTKPNGLVEIHLFSKPKVVSLRYLALLAWFEVGCINNLKEHLDKIRFLPIDSRVLRVRCQHAMVFSKPILYKEGFRYIPSFPRYAISLKGDIVDTLAGIIVDKVIDDRDKYEKAYVFNPDRGMNTWTSVHRLLALAWLPNDDFIARAYVNHINGQRSDNHLENLEWCSHTENVQHALNSGLNTTCVKMKSRDVLSGKIEIYRSAGEMCKLLGTTSVASHSYTTKLPGYLFRGRYEIKLFDDNTPWYYEDADSLFNANNPRKAIFSITTLNKATGEIKQFISLRTFRKEYGIRTDSVNIEDSVVRFKEKFPNHEISYKRNAVSGPYWVFDVVCNKSFILDNMVDVSRWIKRGRSEIQYDLSRHLKYIYDHKWIIVPGTCEYNIDEYTDKPKLTQRVSIDKDGSQTVVRSMKHAAKISGIDFRSVVKSIETGKSVKGVKFRSLDQ